MAQASAVALGVGQVGFDPDAPGVQFDGPLAYAEGDLNAGRPPAIAAAAYTYNKQNDKLTTNFAIDAERGTLVIQGSREGEVPAVSPNTGRLSTVGSLGIERFERASFDIADLTGNGWLAAGTATGSTRWHQVDLQTGKARFVGTIATSDAVVGIAIEP